MKILGSLLLNTLAVAVSAYIIPGVAVADVWSALVVSVVFGILNAIVKPVLLLLTLPINILSLGLFTFVINVLIVFMADALVAGFEVTSFFAALLFSLVLSLVSGFLNSLTK